MSLDEIKCYIAGVLISEMQIDYSIFQSSYPVTVMLMKTDVRNIIIFIYRKYSVECCDALYIILIMAHKWRCSFEGGALSF